MRRGGADQGPAHAWRALAAGGCVLAATSVAGCSLSSQHGNLVNGKQQFVQHCGACHTLAHAGTKGTTGPNLDEAFLRARQDGMKSSTFEGMVHDQISHPSRLGQTDPATGKPLPAMPSNTVTGQDAIDVATYVGDVAGVPGKDSGRLATIGVAASHGTAAEKNGLVAIPTDPSGQLAYQYKAATATSGKVRIESKNASSTPHDIAIQGSGVNAKGAIVSGGGVSKISVTLKPGRYTFFCTVPGHRQAGMVGTLTVK